MRSAAKNHVQLRLCRQTKCPTHIRLKAYLLKCLETSRQPWVRLRFDVIAESFGVTDRTLRRAKRRLEQDPDLKFRTLSKGNGSGWQVIVGQEAKLLWDKEPLFYKRWRDGMRSRNVRNKHCGQSVEGPQHTPVQGIRRRATKQSERIKRLPSKQNVTDEQLTLNQLSEGSNQAVVTSENDDCAVPTYAAPPDPQSDAISSPAPHLKSLPDTCHYRERRTYSSKNRQPALRDRIFACSGPELRRRATGKQLRLAYFEARSAIAWHRWDNIKVKNQPELLKSLWLAGLLAGYTPKQVEKAFAKALTVSHGLATDIGLLENNHRLQFEMSHTVAVAKRILTGVEPENMYYTNKGC